MNTKKLISITQFIDIPPKVVLSPEHVALVSLTDLPRSTRVLTAVGPLRMVVSKEGEVWVKVTRRISGDEPLAEKYGARAVARTMSDATGYVPPDQEEAKRLPRIAAAGWNVPDEVWWTLRLPTTSSGAQVLDAVRASSEFVTKATERLLEQGAALFG